MSLSKKTAIKTRRIKITNAAKREKITVDRDVIVETPELPSSLSSALLATAETGKKTRQNETKPRQKRTEGESRELLKLNR